MIFFLDGAIGMGNSGIEHAQFYRAKRFDQAGLPYKYVYVDLIKELREAMAQWQLANDSVINMWEYFVLGGDYLHSGIKEEVPSQTELLIDSTDTHRKRDTYTKSGLHIVEHLVKYPDKHSKSNILLVSTGRVEIFNTATGKRKVMFEYVDDDHRKMLVRNIHLYDQDGQHLFFTNIVPLRRYFYQQLDQAFSGQNIFFIDRGEDAEDSLFNHSLPNAKVIEAIHADHLADRDDPRYPLWNNYYEYLLTHLDSVEKVIVATELQRQDLLKDFPNAADKIVTIPVGGVRDAEPALNHAKHTPLKLVTASRLAAEKHIDLIVRAVAKLNAENIPVTLDIFGQGEMHDKLEKTIEETKSQDTVTLKGLSNNLAEEYPQYDVFVSASYSEGFGLTYIEALNAALPVVTFNARFGAQELIKDGDNGFLQDFKRDDEDYNVTQLVAGIKRLLAEDYGQLQEHTRASVKDYQDHVIADKWGALINEL
ncbi:MAG: glycosyltransferase [Schleiferilactobacillus perolens]|jgi:accessory Sec system glycosylation protein GtfA|uniref:glycosyltransferase n=1 Tax=Schleiferilactobacillus perolens TaxID=100468 RepID=UPI0039E790B4|nr:glycosyltransferase [Schleiferilactobacillus harbinensis]MCI1912690.1 glycosyltransferase [Schleiferilactobacillus harbinensis]